jgi:hypothetical protein
MKPSMLIAKPAYAKDKATFIDNVCFDVTRVFKFEIKSVTKSTCLDPHSRIQFIEYIETLPVQMRPIKSGGYEPMPSKALLVKGLKSDPVSFSIDF